MTTRRQFLKVSAALGGGLALECSIVASALAQSAAESVEVTHWIVIHPDERIVIRIARSEMGQGSFTGLAQLVAEELDCDWSRVSAEFASPNAHVKRKRIWGSMHTGGSEGIRTSHDYLRKSGAGARAMLISAAAAEWNVPAAECSASAGVITHASSKRTTTYGRVAAAASKLEAPKDVKLKDPKDWKIVGTSPKLLNTPDKVAGKPIFGVDLQLPGMLCASIVQSPVFRGKVKTLDSTAAGKMRGVKGIVREDGFVAVVADNWWRANEAAKKLAIAWDEGDNGNVTTESILASLREGLDAKDLPTARVIGDCSAALASAARVVEAEYRSPYLSHAPIEPMVATAWFRDGGLLEVWASTQTAEFSMAAAADAAGLPLEKVEVHKMMVGGAFGRRGSPQDHVSLAVKIAKQFPNTPVKLMWSREEDMQHGFYRPASVVRMRGGLDAQGNVTAMHTVIACPSILVSIGRPERVEKGIDNSSVRYISDTTYTIPNQRVEYAMRNSHVPVGFWRAPTQQNAFYRECFIDELAHAAGRDPLEFRLNLLKADDKNRIVLEAVARAAGWGKPSPQGVFRGIAQADGFGSYSAAVSEVSIVDGKVKVLRVFSAIDPGYVVHPDACRAQAEGNVIFCMGQLFQAHTLKGGRIVESNFHDFPVPRITQMPKVEAVLVPTGGFWGGAGETTSLSIMPSMLNAVFAATGKRVRTLPLENGKVA